MIKEKLRCNTLNSKSIKSSDLKIEHLVRTSCALAAQLKTSNEENIENLNICCTASFRSKVKNYFEQLLDVLSVIVV